jgi:membrane protein DedA with SNARE-associated domain
MSIEFLSLEQIQEIASEYGYWAIFTGIALENTGIPIPGETITIVGGFLAGSGELDYWLVLITAIAGAVLGDNFGYWLGKFGGWKLLLKIGNVFRIQEKQLKRAREEFSRNGAKAVFFGRFLTLLRIFAGPMAGIAEMPYAKFLLCNVAGATAWASIMVTISFFVGRLIPLKDLVSWITKFGVFALLLVIAWIIIPLWRENRLQKLESKN